MISFANLQTSCYKGGGNGEEMKWRGVDRGALRVSCGLRNIGDCGRAGGGHSRPNGPFRNGYGRLFTLLYFYLSVEYWMERS